MIRVRSAISPRNRSRSRNILMALAIGTVFGMTSLGSQPVHAQDANMSRQVEQLRKDLDLLQRYVYREGTGDAAEAAASTGGGASTPAAARQQVQISALERTTSQLTGQLEEFDFRIRKMEDRLERLVADIDFRLSQLEGGAVSNNGGTGDGAAAPLAAGNAAQGTGTAPNAGATSAQGGAGSGETINDRGTKLFGVIENEGQPPQIPSGTSAANTPAPQTQTAAATTGTPEEQYREAFGLLRRQDFQAAEQALGNFVSNHPNDPLAGNAQYWLGETYYVRGQYENAAIAFTEGFQTYPDSTKAPDNLLKLGMSLANLGKNEDACTAFSHLIDNFPNASNVVLDRARQERQNRGCPQ